MKARHFLNKLQHDKIVTAIREAEKRTSGEIRVFVSRHETEDPVADAQSHFIQLEMDKTREHNGVLIFVAPRSHQFAVIGDEAVHARCGHEFWRALAAEMCGHFKNSDFTQGIVLAIHKAGEILAAHFPRRPDDQNELPDDVAHD